MNFLAHYYLSFQDPALQLGNLLGEIVKGNQYKNFDKSIQQGILLHRAIDTFTDGHLIVQQSSSHFHKTQHKFSPIIIDVVYDYMLIKNWARFSNQPFEQYKTNAYLFFSEISPNHSPSLNQLLYYLLKYDWFGNYRTLEGIQKTLNGIGARTKYPHNLGNALAVIEANEAQIETEFLEFFPELILYCKAFLDEKESIYKAKDKPIHL